MTRQEAYLLLTKYLKNANLIKHCLACEAAMKGVYRYIHRDSIDPKNEEVWGITGLLHDIDYEVAQKTNQLDKHGLLIFDKEPNLIPPDIAHAIKAHNYENTNVEPLSDMDWAIASVDQLTGLIVAATLVHPQKKLEPLTAEYILNRFKEKSFARGAERRFILLCEEKLNISLRTFIEIVLTSMQRISYQLGL